MHLPCTAPNQASCERCDAIVATVLAGDNPVAQEQAVLEFLNGNLVLNWAKVVLGL